MANPKKGKDESIMLQQDHELVFRFKNGDQNAYAELYQKYIKYAFGTALLLLKDSSMASDVCQEAFIKVYRKIHSFKDEYQFKPWFYRIVVNESMRFTRKIMCFPKPIEKMPDIPSNTFSEPQNIIISKEESYEIRQAISKLPIKLKVPIILRYYSDLTEEEIAAALNIPTGTVKSRLSRGRERLERILKNDLSVGGFHHA